MSRVKIELPDSFPFSTPIKVRMSDVNYGGHVGNDAILSIMQEARLQYFRSLGYEHEGGGTEGAGIIMADAAIVYKAESFYGDELEVHVAASDFTRLGFDLVYKITRKADGRDIAHGKTGVVCFDYESRKVKPLSEDFKSRLQN